MSHKNQWLHKRKQDCQHSSETKHNSIKNLLWIKSQDEPNWEKHTDDKKSL